ncbi:uncharacterized protein FIBRA_03016 [Fibroporia radiculosa]|uniref:Uncharacterized protein n=1 Tax=Fibroporia radiculosa TaxID=599839 RepID=J4G3T9_9APHY|nr:uncharacterized protein FIBRA_03016 [Fibroporia radiculosa]CCM00968.1 predicted protein [Fibroporia radiculosa]
MPPMNIELFTVIVGLLSLATLFSPVYAFIESWSMTSMHKTIYKALEEARQLLSGRAGVESLLEELRRLRDELFILHAQAIRPRSIWSGRYMSALYHMYLLYKNAMSLRDRALIFVADAVIEERTVVLKSSGSSITEQLQLSSLRTIDIMERGVSWQGSINSSSVLELDLSADYLMGRQIQDPPPSLALEYTSPSSSSPSPTSQSASHRSPTLESPRRFPNGTLLRSVNAARRSTLPTQHVREDPIVRSDAIRRSPSGTQSI